MGIRRPASATFCLRVVAAFVVALAGTQTETSEAAGRTLYIVLDAVPYSVAAEVTDPALGEKALFKDLKGPVPLVSTFPSSTSTAIPGLLSPLDLEVSPGYEARFYDWDKNKVRGGGPISYYRIEFPWRDFFDLTRRGPVRGAFQALHPTSVSIKRLRKGIDAFVRADKDSYWIYIAETDLAVHLKGPEALKRVFVALDAKLREVPRQHPDHPFEVVILSDHGVEGGEPLQNVWPGVRKAVKQAGYRYSRKLRGPKDVALTPLGLVSNFEAYTYDETKPDVAAVLARVPGVDLCVFETGAGWIIESSRGQAVFRRQESAGEPCWSYEPLGGDPLEYLPLIDNFRQGTGGTGDCLPDTEWSRATADCEYPDAFFRLEKAFELVKHPPSVACSLHPGYMYGPRRTDFVSRIADGPLRWTHGALHRKATLGFLMSDAAAWNPPRTVRFDTALLPFLKIPVSRRQSTSKSN